MKKTFFFLIFFLFSTAHADDLTLAEQTRPAIVDAIQNFFETPFEWIANQNARRKFTDYERETHSQPASSSEVACDPNGSPLPKSALTDLLNIPHVRCQCEAWGNCVKEACACEVLCPKNFNIFRRPGLTSTKSMSEEENSFAFTNFGAAGVCWGHATMNQKFNRLAFFKPDSRPPHSLTSADPEERRKAIRFYKDIIDDIADNKPADIPGYPDLNTFSDDPELQTYIMDKVVNEWSDRAMSWQGLTIALQTSARSRAHNERVFAEARRRLSLNQQPNLVFTFDETRFLTHSLLVSHVEQKEGKEVLCLRDNNSTSAEALACSSYMTLGEDGQISWNMSYYSTSVGGINIAHNDDRDAVKQVKNLHKKCEREKGCR